MCVYVLVIEYKGYYNGGSYTEVNSAYASYDLARLARQEMIDKNDGFTDSTTDVVCNIYIKELSLKEDSR